MLEKKLTLVKPIPIPEMASTSTRNLKLGVGSKEPSFTLGVFLFAIILMGCQATKLPSNRYSLAVPHPPTTNSIRTTAPPQNPSTTTKKLVPAGATYLHPNGSPNPLHIQKLSVSLQDNDSSPRSDPTLVAHQNQSEKHLVHQGSSIKLNRVTNALVSVAEPISGLDKTHGKQNSQGFEDPISNGYFGVEYHQESTGELIHSDSPHREVVSHDFQSEMQRDTANLSGTSADHQRVNFSDPTAETKAHKTNDSLFKIPDLVRRTLKSHPEIRSMELQIQAARHRVPQAASLPDPTFNNTFWPIQQQALQTAAGRVGNQMSLNQKVPWAEKRQLQTALAKKEIEVKISELNKAKSEFTKNVKLTCFELWLSTETTAILQTTKKGLLDLLPIVESRVRSGGLRSDLLKARLAVDQIDQQIFLAREKEQILRTTLSELSGVSITELQRGIKMIASEQLEEELEELYAKAEENNPELVELSWQQQKSKDQVQLADLQRYPDLQFGLHWGLVNHNHRVLSKVANGRDMISFNIGTTLPIWQSKNRSGVREARSLAASVTAKIDSQRSRLLSELRALHISLQSLHQRRKLYANGILPKTIEMLKLGVADYRGQRINFDDLTSLYLDQLLIETEVLRLDAEIASSGAKLERALGVLGAKEDL